MKLIEILNKANPEELKGFAEILEMKNKNHYKAKEIKGEIFLKDSLAGIIFSSDENRYQNLVNKTAKKLKITKKPKLYSTQELEVKISQEIFKKVWDNMSIEQRKELEEKMEEISREHGNKNAIFANAGVFGALTAANLSGFGIYLLATTSLRAITGAMSIALPFAAYTAMTSTLSVIIGPVGWIGAGIFALFSLTGPEYKQIIPSIIYISILRNKNQNLVDLN